MLKVKAKMKVSLINIKFTGGRINKNIENFYKERDDQKFCHE